MKKTKIACAVCGEALLTTLFQRSDSRRVARCMSCDLVQVVPLPKASEVANLYHDDMDHFAPYLAQIDVHRKYFRKKISDMVSRLPAHASPALLDIGCALGILLEEAQRKGLNAQGIDISADAVAYCKKKGLSVTHGTLEKMKFPKNTAFSVITAFELIEHEVDPLQMMKRVYSVLKNDGIAVLTTPDHDSFWQKVMGKSWVSYRHPEHLFFFNPKSLRELFRRAGFRNVSIKKDSPRPFPLSFLFTRAADYFPWASWVLRPIGKVLDKLKLLNPVNPWGDLIAMGVR